ncbi:hypothetical protein N0V93_000846 [Gnomoniopsis smithogilvyi]|uniref:Malate dehydrogenase n=1 Tax=Gnomoniopsis smithogilvyi TaxID=1191159 RepID=A0A9W8Z2Y8_9PEZI|nr:hypothetical protein N0V93_000846 [Gnomoniopsis smithogilvyi]
MHFSQIISVASVLATALTAPTTKCKPPSTTTSPTLPSTGSTDLTAPSTNLTLKYLAVGHGIQNYTCASDNATAVNVGALAVLYDATALYSASSYANLSSTVLWDQAIPLNLLNTAAAGPVSTTSGLATTTFSETDYQADSANPFPSPAADLALTAQQVSASFLGHHYFDSLGAPTFDLSASTDKLFFSGAKIGDVKAPTDADKGVLATGAVDWLELGDNGRGLSEGVSNVYRVVTAGGVAEACSVSEANPTGQVFSVPYVAQYWFYG